jgi:hypothetical protein
MFVHSGRTRAIPDAEKEQSSMTRTFDWEQFAERHKPEWTVWLKANHSRSVTEAEYIEAYRAQRGADTRPHKAVRYATAKLRSAYRNLQEDFGFFL